jgi:NADPH2:quinone reductase
VLGKWLDEGQLKPNKVKLMPHGLDSVQEGVFMLKEKRVSGMKLVYRIEDSLCLQQQQ